MTDFLAANPKAARASNAQYWLGRSYLAEDQFTQAFNWPLGSALSFMMLALVLLLFAAFSGALRGRLALN